MERFTVGRGEGGPRGLLSRLLLGDVLCKPGFINLVGSIRRDHILILVVIQQIYEALCGLGTVRTPLKCHPWKSVAVSYDSVQVPCCVCTLTTE
jgi:hypothetical protein